MKNQILFFGLLASILISSCLRTESDFSTNSSPAVKQLSEEELKMELQSKECNDPNKYISGTLSYKPIYKNALSVKVKGLKIDLVLKSTATLAKYKDIQFRVDFYTKTKKLLFSKNLTAYEFLSPNGSVNYNTEITISNQDYKDINSFAWDVLNASCE